MERQWAAWIWLFYTYFTGVPVVYYLFWEIGMEYVSVRVLCLLSLFGFSISWMLHGAKMQDDEDNGDSGTT